MTCNSHECGALWQRDPDRGSRRADQAAQAPREAARMWRPATLAGIEVLHAAYVTHTFARHRHDGFAIGLIDAGVERFSYRGATHHAPAGRIVVFNADEMHTGEAADEAGWAMRMLYVDPVLLQSVAGDVEGGSADVPFFGDAVIADARLAALLDRLHRALVGTAGALECETRLLDALGHLVRTHADASRTAATGIASSPESPAVRVAREYLDAHATRNVSLTELAQVTGLSRYHLARTFSAEVGVPPHVYLEQRRVDQARVLLGGSLPIGRVGLDAGFSDQSHFTRRFKRHVGVTPRQYRLGTRPQHSTSSSPVRERLSDGAP